jgi:hypothetical protein
MLTSLGAKLTIRMPVSKVNLGEIICGEGQYNIEVASITAKIKC